MAIPTATLHLRLYIAGNAPNSTRAQANLAVICQELSPINSISKLSMCCGNHCGRYMTTCSSHRCY